MAKLEKSELKEYLKAGEPIAGKFSLFGGAAS